MLLAALLLGALCAHIEAVFPVIYTEYGFIRGLELSNATVFLQVPFAQPPLGPLRFKSPQRPEPWPGIKDCTKDPNARICPQLKLNNNTIFGTEDCLYLNIYVPRTPAPPSGFPVMVYIYGGAFEIGAARDRGGYRGVNLAALRNVIVVEANYRLGPLGFLALPELMDESVDRSTGNYGTQDQREALAFTHRNIAQFGGNPNNITLFGQSAGAISVCWHLVSPLSRQYFSTAIMESGTCSSPEFYPSLKQAYVAGDTVLQYTGCMGASEPLACLRSRPLPSLYVNNTAWPTDAPPLAPLIPFGPAIDQSPVGLMGKPIDLLEKDPHPAPLIIGTNLDEGTIFMFLIPLTVSGVSLPLDEAGIQKVLLHFFNASTVTAVLATYPASAFRSEDRRCEAILRDFFFACPSRQAARVVASKGVPAYLYQFSQALPDWLDYLLLGDYHAIELPFVFDNAKPTTRHVFTPKEQQLSDLITQYWTNFTAHADPNVGAPFVWPRYTAAGDESIQLEMPPRTTTGLYRSQCDFWETHYQKYYFD